MLEHHISTTQILGHRTLTSNGSNHAFNRKIMLCTVVILIVAVSLMVCFHVYARWLFGRQHRRSSSNRPALLQASAGAHSGLNLSILKSLPIFVYFGDLSAATLECSVCLSEFEYEEKGRELPKCKHIFHLECIDMWFGSHSTCPLCRAPVELELDHCAANKCEAVGSASGSGELVGVLVEVPPVTRGEVERSRGSLLGSGSGPESVDQHCLTQKSPYEQVFTLKRISSKDGDG